MKKHKLKYHIIKVGLLPWITCGYFLDVVSGMIYRTKTRLHNGKLRIEVEHDPKIIKRQQAIAKEQLTRSQR
jgi:hypothetical protein